MFGLMGQCLNSQLLRARMDIYIASPFFNERQIEILEQTKSILDNLCIGYFSPKDDCLFENDKGMDAGEIFQMNCNEIQECDCLLVITDGLDAGTLWEAGFAYGIGKENILYAWIDCIEGANFNLMLAKSATSTVKGFDQLEIALMHYKNEGFVNKELYLGHME